MYSLNRYSFIFLFVVVGLFFLSTLQKYNRISCLETFFVFFCSVCCDMGIHLRQKRKAPVKVVALKQNMPFFLFYFAHFFALGFAAFEVYGERTLADAELTHVRYKNKCIYFVLCSLNRNFDFVEITLARQNKEKLVFLWFCARLIVTLHRKKRREWQI